MYTYRLVFKKKSIWFNPEHAPMQSTPTGEGEGGKALLTSWIGDVLYDQRHKNKILAKRSPLVKYIRPAELYCRFEEAIH